MPRIFFKTMFNSKQAAQSRLNASKARMPDERLAAAANGDAAAKASALHQQAERHTERIEAQLEAQRSEMLELQRGGNNEPV